MSVSIMPNSQQKTEVDIKIFRLQSEVYRNLMKIAFIITVNQIHLLNSFSFCLTQFEMVLALSLENLTPLHF